MTSSAVLLPISSAGTISVSVHPVALFSICDAYIRRNQGQGRVIGTLLGSITDGVFEVKGCYVVPHTENVDQVRPNGRPCMAAGRQCVLHLCCELCGTALKHSGQHAEQRGAQCCQI